MENKWRKAKEKGETRSKESIGKRETGKIEGKWSNKGSQEKAKTETKEGDGKEERNWKEKNKKGLKWKRNE